MDIGKNSKFLTGCGSVLVAVLTLVACKHDSEMPTVYDDSRIYKLPYESGKDRFLIQGYDGPFSHSGYELDFVMPVGSLVLASRGGVVSGVVDVWSESCPLQKDCANNYISIDHLDGTWGEYLHIKKGGACVEIGQTIAQGDGIALSGNVGISLLPHVHFSVAGNVVEPPVFADIDSRGSGIPVPAVYYLSANLLATNHCDNED